MSAHSHTRSAVAPAELLDPVCGMTIAPEDAAGHVDYQGQRYYFCCQACKMEFDDNPDAYARM